MTQPFFVIVFPQGAKTFHLRSLISKCLCLFVLSFFISSIPFNLPSFLLESLHWVKLSQAMAVLELGPCSKTILPCSLPWVSPYLGKPSPESFYPTFFWQGNKCPFICPHITKEQLF